MRHEIEFATIANLVRKLRFQSNTGHLSARTAVSNHSLRSHGNDANTIAFISIQLKPERKGLFSLFRSDEDFDGN